MNNLSSLRCLRNTTTSIRPSLLLKPTTSTLAHQTSPFSTSSPQLARVKGKGGPKKDPLITQIRYFLQHPLTPRPLRFSRLRSLRHWTIHRAWQLYTAQQRKAKDLELERQYNTMRDACETLRLMDGNGMIVKEGDAAAQGKDVGRLYRIAMSKKGIWGGVPIEYARIQVENPGQEPWNHGWTR